ncbi:MAG: hypothetical protein QHJ73_06200 [Armatimonadota bacterium]|nr:hypothetical protein [Armatimonadota bacterium]
MFTGASLGVCALLHGALSSACFTAADENREARYVGSRLELMADTSLVERTNGVRFRLHHPVAREVAMVHDQPWEGSGCGYHSVFQDGDRYRMYYRTWQLTVADGKLAPSHPLYLCYAESRDGIHWVKPELGLFEFQGSKRNNIVMVPGRIGQVEADTGHPAVFRDENPQCDPQSRYKAIIRSGGAKGLLPFGSPDGLRWRPLSDAPVITRGDFDSQNLAFWDPVRAEYRAYFRFFREGVRDILTATSKDFLHWTEPEPLRYPGAPSEHLYTNQIKPYYRAPHLLIGFPTRYVERGWSPAMRALPERAHREERARVSQRYGTALTEALFMISRDGVTFHRWGEAFLRPGPERPGTWLYGHQYIAWQLVETASTIPGEPNELSLYALEGYWTGTSNALRRYTLRLDGFVSIEATLAGGEFTTRPLLFSGNRLVLNLSTSAAGGVRVELQDAGGDPIPGFRLEECPEVFGDSVERAVTWKEGSDVSRLAGRPVRLRVFLRDADLYSFQFRQVP